MTIKKSLLVLILIVSIFSIIFVLSVLWFMNSMYYDVNTVNLKNTARTFVSLIGEERIQKYFIEDAAIDEIKVTDDTYRVTLIDTNGYVLWDSSVTGELVNHIDRAEIKAALEGREGISRRDSISTGMRQIYFAIPVYDNDSKIVGVFRLSYIVQNFWSRISFIAIPFMIFALLLTLIAFLAIFVFSGSMSKSVDRLTEIAREALSAPSIPVIPVESATTEFYNLENALRDMSIELNTRFEEIRATKGRLEAILNGMSEAVFAMDKNLTLLLVNPKARELFNFEEKDIQSITLLEATGSTELEQTAKKILSGSNHLEIEMAFHKGKEQYFQVYATSLSSVNGKAEGVVLVLLDITRLVKLEKVRRDFVANVSHELRTPIQLIMGFSENLLENKDTEQTDRFIKIINKNASVMDNITNDLLVLASLENDANKKEGMNERFVAPLISEAVSSVEPQANKKQIEFTIVCSSELKAKLHSSYITLALINLIDNAIKYSPSGSRVTVEASLKNNFLVLSVSDTGIGIPAAHHERIFERFYRVDKNRGREAGGTGLGLSIVRHIAILHNGYTEVESRTGEGSIFRINIPVNPR